MNNESTFLLSKKFLINTDQMYRTDINALIIGAFLRSYVKLCFWFCELKTTTKLRERCMTQLFPVINCARK